MVHGFLKSCRILVYAVCLTSLFSLVTFNPRKCVFSDDWVSLIGYKIGSAGILLDLELMSALVYISSSDEFQALLSILGALHYYSGFFQNFWQYFNWSLDIPSDERFSWPSVHEQTLGELLFFLQLHVDLKSFHRMFLVSLGNGHMWITVASFWANTVHWWLSMVFHECQKYVGQPGLRLRSHEVVCARHSVERMYFLHL